MADRDAEELVGRCERQPPRPIEVHDLAGTGVVWTLSGGVPRPLGLIGGAAAAETPQSELLLCRSATATSASTCRPTPTRAPR